MIGTEGELLTLLSGWSTRTLSLPEQIAAKVSSQVIIGELRPGQRIQEQALARQFDVSRGPIREALRILEKDGLVKIEPRRGVSVTLLSVQEVNDIFEIRAGLLGVAAKLATERQDADSIRYMAQSAERLKVIAADGDAEQYLASVQHLNLTMARLSHNPRLAEMISSLVRQTLRYARLGLSTAERRKQSARNWRRLADAMKRNDAAAAKAAAEQLVHDSRLMAMRLLAEQEDDAASAEAIGAHKAAV